jgi:HK97 family phage portal protein
MQKNGLGSILAVDAYGSEFFQNGGQLKGVITLDHPVKDFERLRKGWKAAYGGTSGMHGVAILEDGAKYQNISLPPEDSQFLASRKFGVEEICRIFRVPPHLVQYLDKASYASIEEQGIDFATYTLGPWAERIQDAIAKDVLLESERDNYYAKFNLNSLQRGNYQNRMNGYATARSNGWMSMNDIRELEDFNPVPADKGGEDILINGSYVRVEDAGLAYGQNAMAEREKQASQNNSNSGGTSERTGRQRNSERKGGETS